MSNVGPVGFGELAAPMSNVIAANGGSPNGDKGELMIQLLARIAYSIAPPQWRQRTTFIELAVGASLSSQVVNQSTFNSFLIGVTSGVINIYVGGTFLMQVQATPNPFNVYFPRTNVSGTIQFEVDASSSSSANGFIDIMQY